MGGHRSDGWVEHIFRDTEQNFLPSLQLLLCQFPYSSLQGASFCSGLVDMKCPLISFPFSFPQEVIRIIKQKGPKTENIFQKVGDIKSFIALKERFNTGDRGDWGNESPLVLATLLKVGGFWHHLCTIWKLCDGFHSS